MKNFRLFLILLITFISLLGKTFSQVDLEEIKSKLPKMLGASNAGTEFVFGFHPCWEEVGPNNAVRIYVTSTVETEVRLTIPGLYPQPFLVKKTKPNDVIEFVLTPENAQPYTRRSGGATSTLKPTQVWKGRGIIVESNDPVIVYGMVRYQYTSDGFLALPVNALGKDYIISSYRETANFTYQSLTPYSDIIGVYDSTTVRYHIGGNNNSRIRTIDDKLWKPYQVITTILNKADFWLIASEGPQSDLGGGWVEADKPVSVLSGSHCSYVPTGNSACDFLIEQELPTISWGKKYYVTPLVDRKFASVIRLFGQDTPTDIYRNGVLIDTLYSNWGTEDEAWRESRANPDGNIGTTYTSTKPIHIVQYNTGQSEDGVQSDPFQMMLMPEEFFQNELIFNTPGIRGGYGFARNYVNVVYKAKIGQIPDDLELGEIIPTGEIHWKKIKDISSSVGSNLNDPDFIGTDTVVYSKTIKFPYDGVYHLRCTTQKIMAYAYGFGSFDSYGFPVGGVFMDNNRDDNLPPQPTIFNVQTPPIYVTGSAIAHGFVEDVDDQGNGDLALIVHNIAYSYNTKVEFKKFIPGEAKRVDFTVSMLDSTKDALAVITFADRAGNDSTISVEFKAKEFVKAISVTKPTSDYKFRQGQKLPIEWISNFLENVKLELYRGDKFVLLISASDTNDGVSLYNIYTLATKGTNYRIKASSTLEPNVFGFSQEFEILEYDIKKSITLIQPSIQAMMERGKKLQIIWQLSLPFPVNIDLYSGNTFVSKLEQSLSDTNYIWTIPLDLDVPRDYKIRICDVVDSNLFVETPIIRILFDDASKKLTFLSPLLNTKYYLGSTLPISWNCNFPGNVQIDLYKDDTLFLNIANDYNNTGYYYWNIPKNNITSKFFSVRITETGKTNVNFTSDKFEIYNPVSVDENDLLISNLKISPNPTNTELEIELLRSGKIQNIAIYSMTGRNELSVSNLNESNTKIDISNLPVGKYILEILTTKGKITESFVIVR